MRASYVIAAALIGCVTRVVVPPTPEGDACVRECQALVYICRARMPVDAVDRAGNDIACAVDRRGCLLRCPGAYEVQR